MEVDTNILCVSTSLKPQGMVPRVDKGRQTGVMRAQHRISEVDGFVKEMSQNYQLIADYFQRPMINEQSFFFRILG